MAASSARKRARRAPKPTRVKGPEAPPEEVSLEQVIYNKPGFLARRLQQIAVSIFLDETSEYDITPLQYGVMAVVRATPGIDQIGVSSGVGLDRTTVVGIVDRLERKGLIARRADPSDRRVRQLYLTQPGQQKLFDMHAATERVQKRLLEPLSAKERAVFLEYIDRIVSHHNEDSRVPVTDPALRATITGDARTGAGDGEARA